jgi:hypothetical protein
VSYIGAFVQKERMEPKFCGIDHDELASVYIGCDILGKFGVGDLIKFLKKSTLWNDSKVVWGEVINGEKQSDINIIIYC